MKINQPQGKRVVRSCEMQGNISVLHNAVKILMNLHLNRWQNVKSYHKIKKKYVFVDRKSCFLAVCKWDQELHNRLLAGKTTKMAATSLAHTRLNSTKRFTNLKVNLKYLGINIGAKIKLVSYEFEYFYQCIMTFWVLRDSYAVFICTLILKCLVQKI